MAYSAISAVAAGPAMASSTTITHTAGFAGAADTAVTARAAGTRSAARYGQIPADIEVTRHTGHRDISALRSVGAIGSVTTVAAGLTNGAAASISGIAGRTTVTSITTCYIKVATDRHSAATPTKCYGAAGSAVRAHPSTSSTISTRISVLTWAAAGSGGADAAVAARQRQ